MPLKNKKNKNKYLIPGFKAVEKSRSKSEADAEEFLGPDAETPSVSKLHKKYHSDSGESKILAKAKSPKSESATKPVIMEPKDKGDTNAKRLTVLVKEGKIRALQG